MKKLINNPENVLNDMLCGLEVAYPDYLRKLDNFNRTIIYIEWGV